MMIVLINGKRYIAEIEAPDEKLPFGELIRRARIGNSETLEEAAHAIGTDKSWLWRLEHGRALPNLRMLQKILLHYGVDFSSIKEITGSE